MLTTKIPESSAAELPVRPTIAYLFDNVDSTYRLDIDLAYTHADKVSPRTAEYHAMFHFLSECGFTGWLGSCGITNIKDIYSPRLRKHSLVVSREFYDYDILITAKRLVDTEAPNKWEINVTSIDKKGSTIK